MKTKTILIIEDDKALLNALTTKIQNAGYETMTALNGELGLEKALRKEPDLILLDIRMPQMNGMEMMKELRKNSWGSGVPIIILSNVNPQDDESLQGILDYHPSYFLMKADCGLKCILEKINELLSDSSNED